MQAGAGSVGRPAGLCRRSCGAGAGPTGSQAAASGPDQMDHWCRWKHWQWKRIEPTVRGLPCWPYCMNVQLCRCVLFCCHVGLPTQVILCPCLRPLFAAPGSQQSSHLPALPCTTQHRRCGAALRPSLPQWQQMWTVALPRRGCRHLRQPQPPLLGCGTNSPRSSNRSQHSRSSVRSRLCGPGPVPGSRWAACSSSSP